MIPGVSKYFQVSPIESKLIKVARPPPSPQPPYQPQAGLIGISEVKGSSYGLSYPLEREIDFDFDFDSSVPCVAGEAKLCVRVRRASLTLGLILGRMSPAFAAGLRAIFHARHVGFKYFYVFIEAAG